eukprot:TRINITY_DN2396_c0_g1_i2.p1 TRINITY_DN2396_c0_g1~~TRINITY_DN2396_c0_g1_i2.p1  ORF type:complete len:505 (+),score=147.60 TRINITY_DN2396_c0_g1_i2:260-1774(+)
MEFTGVMGEVSDVLQDTVEPLVQFAVDVNHIKNDLVVVNEFIRHRMPQNLMVLVCANPQEAKKRAILMAIYTFSTATGLHVPLISKDHDRLMYKLTRAQAIIRGWLSRRKYCKLIKMFRKDRSIFKKNQSQLEAEHRERLQRDQEFQNLLKRADEHRKRREQRAIVDLMSGLDKDSSSPDKRRSSLLDKFKTKGRTMSSNDLTTLLRTPTNTSSASSSIMGGSERRHSTQPTSPGIESSSSADQATSHQSAPSHRSLKKLGSLGRSVSSANLFVARRLSMDTDDSSSGGLSGDIDSSDKSGSVISRNSGISDLLNDARDMQDRLRNQEARVDQTIEKQRIHNQFADQIRRNSDNFSDDASQPSPRKSSQDNTDRPLLRRGSSAANLALLRRSSSSMDFMQGTKSSTSSPFAKSDSTHNHPADDTDEEIPIQTVDTDIIRLPKPILDDEQQQLQDATSDEIRDQPTDTVTKEQMDALYRMFSHLDEEFGDSSDRVQPNQDSKPQA